MQNDVTAAWACALFSVVAATSVWGESFKVLYNFPNSSPPGSYARLLCAGNAYYGLGRGVYGNGSVFRLNSDGSGYVTIKNFPPTAADPSGTSTNSDGLGPLAGVIIDGDTLFGTAYAGGHSGMGTVFSLKTNGGNFNVLKHFSGPDGKAPYSELLLVSNVLYGTTAAGGEFGKGTVFQISPDGSAFKILKSFDRTNGLLPLSGLTFSEGMLYGTTVSGGVSNYGSVFRIRTNGTDFATLKEFTGEDGTNPRYNLIVAGRWIYGTTEGGGSQSLVYRLSVDGDQYQVLKAFSALDSISGTNEDGSFVQSGLALCAGTLFGSTRWGGFHGCGVLFALRLDGSDFTVLRHFPALTNSGNALVNSEGAKPGPLTFSDGSLYGTPESGGSMGAGTLFCVNLAPRIGLEGNGLGSTPSGFAFEIMGYANQMVRVEASAELESPSWLPLATNRLGPDPTARFVDQQSTNFPRRVYRLQMQ